ncbi:MAG: ATP-binding protein [Candidatus Omnitrophota bacterium]
MEERRKTIISKFRLASEFCAVFSAVLGIAAVAGWAFNIDALKAVIPGSAHVMPNHALAIVASAAAIWLLQTKRLNKNTVLVARILAAAIFLLGLVTLSEYILNSGPGIDQLIFKESVPQAADPVSGIACASGRMSPNSCVNFILIGLALLLLDKRTKRSSSPAQTLILIEGSLSFLAIVGYTYGVRLLYGIASCTMLSLTGAVTFLTIFLSVLFARPDTGVMTVLTRDNAGGMLARRLVFLALIVPLAAEWVVDLGHGAGLYDNTYHSALHAVIVIIAFLYISISTAKTLSRTDDDRAAMERRVLDGLDELARKNEEIKKSEEKYREVVEDANSIIMRMDVEGRVTFFNEFAQAFFGYEGREIIGKNVIGTIVPLTDSAGRDLRVMIDDIMRNPRKYINNENENMVRGGNRVWIAWTNRPIVNKEGVLREILCVGNEITKLKQAEDEMLKAKDAAESANKAKSTFLAHMSHELRTPLNSIIGFSELMKDGLAGQLTDKQKEYAGYISTSGKHLLSLINDILDLSKIEAGKMELELGEFNIRELLKSCFLLIREKALLQGIHPVNDVTDDLGTIRADERKIKQVVFNLLSNAVKFTPEGGKVGIEAKRSASGEVTVTIWDTGIGIEEKDAAKVFAEFEQIDSEYSRKYAGTGLGMPLSKKFIELHGGKMWFESPGKGKGSRFYFTLPVKS